MEIYHSSLQKITNDILEGMKSVKKEMQDKGIFNDETAFEDMSKYAGSHIRITIQPERPNPEDASNGVCDGLNNTGTC